MAGVEAQELLAREGVAEVKLVRADDVALRADAEELALDGVAVVAAGRSARRRSRRATRRAAARGPLRSTGVSLEPSGIQTLVMHGVPSALPIAAPMRRQAMPWSIQNRRIASVGVGQGVAVGRQGVGEIGGVEVHADPPATSPSRSSRWKCSGSSASRSTLLAAGLGVAGVEVQAMRAGQERQRLVEIGPKLVGRAGLAGIIAGDRQAAADLLAGALEPADVVALPAVERDRDGREPRQGRLDIDAPLRVLLLRLVEGRFHVRSGERSWSVSFPGGMADRARPPTR